MSCGVGSRLSLDLALLWLWCRPAAIALIRPQAWEPTYAMCAALKKKNKKKKILFENLEYCLLASGINIKNFVATLLLDPLHVTYLFFSWMLPKFYECLL